MNPAKLFHITERKLSAVPVELIANSTLSSENNPECMGAVWGLVGKLKVHPSLEDYLVLIRECERIGELPDPRGSRYPVYRIKSVALIPISPSPPVLDPPLKSCPKHHVGNVDAHSFEGAEGGQSSRFPFKALGGKISQVRDSLKNTAGSAATGIAAQVLSPTKLQNYKNFKHRLTLQK